MATGLRKTYKAILFDLGKVVISFDFALGYRSIEAMCGLPASEVRTRLAATNLFREIETGTIQAADFHASVQQTLNFRCEYTALCEAWNSIFHPEPLIPEQVLANLKRDYRLLIASNTNSIHFAMLRRNYPVLSHFHDFVLSFETGAMKPDPKYYAAALLKTEHPPENCLFIDDLAENVDGARLAGMEAIQFRSVGQLKLELQDRGISWKT